MTLYIGNKKIADTGTHGIYVGSRAINAVYYGSRKVYQYLPTQSAFQASDSFQTYVVPKGCTKLLVDVVGAKGHNGNATGGKGGRVQCTLTVTEGQTLYLFVAPQPTNSNPAYNATDIRTNNAGITDTNSLNSRLVVAGGGGSGGAGSGGNGNGGAGGGLTGAQGAAGGTSCYGGAGGTQTAGGVAGDGTAYVSYRGQDGAFGLGGSGVHGGAGGAGWYGGGGGGGHSYYSEEDSGGGGGSSYTHPTLCSGVTHTQGYQAGNGWMTITPTK